MLESMVDAKLDQVFAIDVDENDVDGKGGDEKPG